MPKQKTNKSVMKRIKITGTGKIMRCVPGKGHLRSRKSPSQIRRFRKKHELSPAFSKTIITMIGGR